MTSWRCALSLALPLILLLAACTGPAAGQAAPPTPNVPSPSPETTAPPYGVLVDLLSRQDTYDISVVAGNGRVVARQNASKRSPVSNLLGHGLDLPYVSASSTRLYFLEGDRDVYVISMKTLALSVAPAAHLDVGTNMEATFAVSPDDTKIAVGVLDFGQLPVHVRIYVESLITDQRQVIFESDSDYVWPVGWHGGLLVLAHAYGPTAELALKAAPARDNPYWAVSYHVVDPATANRVTLIGSCTVSGPLSPAGSACIQGGSIDWSGMTTPWSTHDWGSISAAASISPDGRVIAAADPDHPQRLDFWRPGGAIATWVDGPGSRDWAGWLDDTHVLVASADDVTFQPRVVALTVGQAPAVAISDAHGFYAARLPTDVV